MCTNTAILNNNFPNCSTNKTFIRMSQCFLCPGLQDQSNSRKKSNPQCNTEPSKHTKTNFQPLLCPPCMQCVQNNEYIYIYMPPHWSACLRINAQCVPYITNYNAPEWNQHLNRQNHFGSTSEISCWSINKISEVDSTVCIKIEFANKQNSQEKYNRYYASLY